MSHFTVVIIGGNPEEQLAPYQEADGKNMDEKYLKFVETEEECRKNWNTQTTEMMRTPEGELVNLYDSKYSIKNKDILEPTVYKFPENWVKVEVPFTEIYPSFSNYMIEYEGGGKDSDTGKYGYWKNENAKWDWYVLGGRWEGFFKIKTLDNKPVYFDSCHWGNIDYQGMIKEARKKALDQYEEYEKKVTVSPKEFVTWKEVVERFPGDIKSAREFYKSQEWIKAINSADLDVGMLQDAGKFWHIQEDDPKASFIKEYVDAVLIPFAVIKHGVWYERGEMGWWGCIADEKEATDWRTQVHELYGDLEYSTLVSMYDCHI